MEGDRIAFEIAAGDGKAQRYEGRINGSRIQGEGWQATRDRDLTPRLDSQDDERARWARTARTEPREATGPLRAHLLSVPQASAMLIGAVVGIGIFKTPPIVAANSDSAPEFIALGSSAGCSR